MITALEKDAFIAAAWDVVGLYETAMASIGLPVDPSSDAVAMFRMVLAEGRSLIRQRTEIERRAEVMLDKKSGITSCSEPFPASDRSTR